MMIINYVKNNGWYDLFNNELRNSLIKVYKDKFWDDANDEKLSLRTLHTNADSVL